MCNTIRAVKHFLSEHSTPFMRQYQKFPRFPNPVMCFMVCLFSFVCFNLPYLIIYFRAVSDNNMQMALKIEIIHQVAVKNAA